MTHNEFKEKEFPKVWDATMLLQAYNCPRQLYWFLRRVDYVTKPSYFSWGSAFQEALLAWYEQESALPYSDEWDSNKKTALRKGLSLWDKEGEDYPPDNTRENLREVFESYLDSYPTEPWGLVSKGGEVGWQWPLSYMDINTEYMLAGSLDGYIEWPGYGTLVLENKTTSQYLSDNFVSQWSYSIQITNYIWYLSQLTNACYGCLMNLITKKKPGKKSNWKTPRFTRVLQRRTPKQLEHYLISAHNTIEQFKRFWEVDYFPQTLDMIHCAGAPGKAACKMKKICLMNQDFREINPPEVSEELIYLNNIWEPWNRQGSQQ